MVMKMVGSDASYIWFVVKKLKHESMSAALSEKLFSEFWFYLSNA